MSAGRTSIRRTALVLAFVLLGLASAAALTSCGGSTETITVTETEERTVTETETVEAAPEQQPDDAETESGRSSGSASGGRTERKFKQTGVDGDIAFTVKSWRTAQQLPQEYADPVSAGPGAKFVLVDVSYTNKGQSALEAFCGSSGATLIDEQDRNFDHDSQIGLGLSDNPLCDDVQPGFREDVTLVFKLPKNAKPNSVAVWDDDDENEDILGSGRDSYVLFGS